MTELELVKAQALSCDRCVLSKTRGQVVFGAGAAPADLMLVGEAPGASEDERGIPFAGAAGPVLDELLAAIELTRSEVFVTNMLLCRPPANRDPKPAEITACSSYLSRQAELVQPRVIGTLGAFATKLISGKATAITRCHGKELEVRVGPKLLLVYPLYQPSLALHVPSMRRVLLEDFMRIPELLERELDDPYETQADAEETIEQLGLFTTGGLVERP